LDAAGVERDFDQHRYWTATGGVTFRDPDGRAVVFAPFAYGSNGPADTSAQGSHGFRDAPEP
jgi:hypothetical protein